MLSTYATARVDFNTEQRLLQTQTKQAAAVLSSSILVIQRPLTSALDLQRAVDGDPEAFRTSMAPYVGPGKVFVSASLWKRTGEQVRPLAATGITPALDPESSAAQAHVLRSYALETFAVRRVEAEGRLRIGFAEAGKNKNFAVYAERAIPEDRRTPSDRNSAFTELHYATYLGRTTAAEALVTTDLPGTDLAATTENTYRTEIPFGDTQLTMVATPRGHLGGSLSERLPIILLLAGLLLTALASRLVFDVVRGRQVAESDADTIASLYERVDAMYAEQRQVSVRLQRALLPPSKPVIPEWQIASEYVAGAKGVDIGGDWWSIVRLDEDRFAFVVGDVSGHGIDAVAVMARARFTLRAYLLDGQAPNVALEKCSRQFDISVDGHMATVLVGVGNRETGEVTLANAGHPPPLLLSARGDGEFLHVPIGPPLGTGFGSYQTATMTVPTGATLIAYTDGLIERRGEDVDLSLDRLRVAAERLPKTDLNDFVAAVLEAMKHEGDDDIAVLALQRAPSGAVP